MTASLFQVGGACRPRCNPLHDALGLAKAKLTVTTPHQSFQAVKVPLWPWWRSAGASFPSFRTMQSLRSSPFGAHARASSSWRTRRPT